jgi:hypothetical protein
MTNPNPFGDFESDFQKVDKAAPGAVEKLHPTGTYKFVCTTKDLKDDGVLVDHEVFSAKTETKGFKLFCEIVEPESAIDENGQPVKVKGEVVDHVFWVTKNNLPYVKRDLATILGRDLTSMGEITNLTWAGRTFEGVLTHEKDNKGIMRNRIAFINPWTPPADDKSKESAKGKEDAAKGTKGKPEKEVAF